jgi:hypothetical protein
MPSRIAESPRVPIEAVQYVIHPLYAIDDQREETLELVDRLVELAKDWSLENGQLVILDFEHPALSLHYDRPNHQQALKEYFTQGKRLIEALDHTPFFMGTPYTGSRARGHVFSLHFGGFLSSYRLKFSQSVAILGRGVYNGECVQTRTECLSDAIRFRTSEQPRIIIPSETVIPRH